MKRGRFCLLSVWAASTMLIVGCPFFKPPMDRADFTEFVSDLVLNQTSDTAEPTNIDELEFEFDEDESAFDELLQSTSFADERPIPRLAVTGQW